MKRLVAPLLLALAVALTGCGESEEPDSQSTEPAEVVPQEDEPAAPITEE